jgi:hypothetical protein
MDWTSTLPFPLNQIGTSPIAWMSALLGSIAGYKLCFGRQVDWLIGVLRFLGYPIAFALLGWAYDETFKIDPGLSLFKLITLPLVLAYVFVGIPLMAGWIGGGAIGAVLRLVGLPRERREG